MKVKSIVPFLIGALCFLFIASASKCESTTDFPPYVKEVCGDNLDNDGDGLTDCKDSDCADECKGKVTLNPVSSLIQTDSIQISGTVENIQSINIQISPSGMGGAGIITGNSWQGTLSKMLAEGSYTVTVIGISTLNQPDTVTQKFTRKN